MKKRLRGSLTVEAALVLPIFLIAVLTMIYIIKILFIHETVQYSLNETANEMATYAYILEKSEILNAQQDIYKTSRGKVQETGAHLGNIIDEAQTLYNAVEGAGTYLGGMNPKPTSTLEDMPKKASLGEFMRAYADHIKGMKTYLVEQGKGAYKHMGDMMTSLEYVLTSMDSTLTHAFLAEGLELTNNYVGTQIARELLKGYISKEQCKKWHIVGGMKGFDFTRSRYMLANEDIDLIVQYDLAIPIPIPGIDQVTMVQRAKVRAYTGNGNHQVQREGATPNVPENKVNVGEQESEAEDREKENRIVYHIQGSSVYHTFRSCIQKISYPLAYEPKYKSKLCKLCAKDVDYNTLEVIYQVPSEKGTNRYHVVSPCSKHYSKNVREIPLSEAHNLRECGKCINMGKDGQGKWYSQ